MTRFHCCCRYRPAITFYGVFLWIFGILILINICFQFQNKYLPRWYPIAGICLFVIYLAGLILFTIWWCKDTYGTRTTLKIAGWLILGSTLALIILCVALILTYDKDKDSIKVGNGDDDEDYQDYSRTAFFLNYLIGGLVVIFFVMTFLWLAFGYDDEFPPEEKEEEPEEDMMKEEMMMDKDDGAMMDGM